MVHMVYTVKHDGRLRARLVANGRTTAIPLESVYSGVVSLRGLRLVLFASELNDLTLWATDIASAYLQARTREKLYLVADEYFGKRAGHILLVQRALYGLKLSGKMWAKHSARIFCSMGFERSKTQDMIWIRDAGDHYEYIAQYVDDLAIASKNPKAICDVLETEHGFKLSGTGPLVYHLGCDFFRDEHYVLCMSPQKYIDKMIQNYELTFVSKPKSFLSPLEKGDHPELDKSQA